MKLSERLRNIGTALEVVKEFEAAADIDEVVHGIKELESLLDECAAKMAADQLLLEECERLLKEGYRHLQKCGEELTNDHSDSD